MVLKEILQELRCIRTDLRRIGLKSQPLNT